MRFAFKTSPQNTTWTGLQPAIIYLPPPLEAGVLDDLASALAELA